MKLKYAFKRTITNSSASARQETKPEVPDGMLKKCNACKGAVFVDEVKKNNYICPHCGNYFRIHARRRIEMIADEGTFEEWDSVMPISNPLSYKGYPDKVKKLQEKTGLDEAIVTGRAKIGGVSAVLGVCDSRFLMASMGENVGEKIVRAVEKATEERLPVVLFACSGGARMQEGIVSLMQMAKTSAALKRHSDAGLLYISVLTNPTTGGVTASFAMLGGYYSCRTRCTHWFCRAERHRADHPSEASKGLSEVRISSGTRLYRPDCRAKGYERNTGTASENALRECCR